MKILRRLFYGITFIPTFFILFFIIGPINWLFKGEFFSFLKRYMDFIENL